jgi:preprotein translocase subunit SecE
LAERRSPKPQVGGSIPSWPANPNNDMNNSEQVQNKIIPNLSWLGIVLVTILAFVATYAYNLSAPVIAIIWIFWLLLSLGLAYLTPQGQLVFSFAQESKAELDKVVWPTRQETVQTTLIVVAMVGIAGFVLWGVDSAMMWIIGKITHLG